MKYTCVCVCVSIRVRASRPLHLPGQEAEGANGRAAGKEAELAGAAEHAIGRAEAHLPAGGGECHQPSNHEPASVRRASVTLLFLVLSLVRS